MGLSFKHKKEMLSFRGNRPPSLFLCLMVFGLILLHENAYGSERYYINDSPVLLYKIINWWYDSSPEDDANYCGSRVACRSTGNCTVIYHEKEKKLVLQFEQGIANLLSVTKPCDRCFGPSYLKCTYLNQDMLGKGNAGEVIFGKEGIESIVFHDIDPIHGFLSQDNAARLTIEVCGTVCGLLGGKISLHSSGDLIKRCSEQIIEPDQPPHITLNIIDSFSNTNIATYSAVWNLL